MYFHTFYKWLVNFLFKDLVYDCKQIQTLMVPKIVSTPKLFVQTKWCKHNVDADYISLWNIFVFFINKIWFLNFNKLYLCIIFFTGKLFLIII